MPSLQSFKFLIPFVLFFVLLILLVGLVRSGLLVALAVALFCLWFCLVMLARCPPCLLGSCFKGFKGFGLQTSKHSEPLGFASKAAKSTSSALPFNLDSPYTFIFFV